MKNPIRYLKGLVRQKFNFRLLPANQLKAVDQGHYNWESTGDDPYFYLESTKTDVYPDGWVEIDLEAEEAPRHPLLLVLYVNDGKGYRESTAMRLPSPKEGSIHTVLKLPPRVVGLRLDPTTRPGLMRVGRIRIRELTKFELLFRLVGPRIGPLFFRKGYLVVVLRKYWDLWKAGGIEAIKNRFMGHTPNRTAGNYVGWVKHYDMIGEGDRSAIRGRIAELKYRPLISIVMPVYNVEEKWLRSAVDSVLNQIYPHWELCIADDASPKPHIKAVLAEYQKRDPRIKVEFRKENGHISAASNSALALARGEFVALMDHDDELAEHALYMVAEELNAHPDTDMIYSDEDKIDENGVRYAPHFKSDWNPDLFFSVNYICHLTVYRSSIVKAVGGFRKGFEGSQDYDLAIRVVEATSDERIRHIPHILYHWRAIAGSTALASSEKNYAHEAGRNAIRGYFERRGVPAEVCDAGVGSLHRVKYRIAGEKPAVSLVVCTRDRLDLIRNAATSILERTDYPCFELVIVNNQSTEPETLEFFREIAKNPKVRVIDYDAPFNYSAMNNFAVRQTHAPIVGLINNDIEAISPGWLSEMVSHILRPEVGAVGAKLYYPDNTVQHAGVMLGIGVGVAAHSHRGLPKDAAGYEFRPHLLQSLSAVTAACMLVRREVFEEVNGLDAENLPVAFNDVDLCLRIREKGYRIILTPYAELFHLESASRGTDDSSRHNKRYLAELEYMKKRWGALLLNDPYYNPNLTLEWEDFSLAFPPRAEKPWRATRAS